MKHSIIIPHRDRNERLEWCCASIRESAKRAGIDDYVVHVVDNGSKRLPEPGPHVNVIVDRSPMRPFNKPKLQNIGITFAAGEVLSFIDADSIVGPDWMATVQDRLGEPSELVKLCYRVRKVPIATWRELVGDSAEFPPTLETLVGGPEQIAFEAYGALHPDCVAAPSRWRHARDMAATGTVLGPAVFGNSQFSIRREKLGNLCFDESFAGRGWEDLAMSFLLWRQYGPRYIASIETEWRKAMFHLHAPEDASQWRLLADGRMSDIVNRERFRRLTEGTTMEISP